MPIKKFYWLAKPLSFLLGLAIGLHLLAYVLAEGLWFQSLGYLEVFLRQVQTRLGLGLVVLIGSAGFLFGNLLLASKLRYRKPEQPSPETMRGIQFAWLLPLVSGCSLLLVMLLYNTGQVALQFWQPNPEFIPQLHQFELPKILQDGWQLSQTPWLLGLGLLLAVGLLIYPQGVSWAIALALSLTLTLTGIGNWTTLLKFLAATPFGKTDPLFEQDIGFYIFTLPLWQLLQFWLVAVVVGSFLSISLIYLLSADSFSQGYFPGFSRSQRRHLQGLGAVLMLAIALSYWLDRYGLVYANRGVTFGAGYTDAIITLPLFTALAAIALLLAVLLLFQSVRPQRPVPSQRESQITAYPGPAWLGIGLVGFTLAAALVGPLLPVAIQTLRVQPNELERELPYIQRTIEYTRQAYGLGAIRARAFDPQPDLNYATIQANDLTIGNIRLWDSRPLLQTNRQLQQLRPYYYFPNAFIDRYTLQTPTNQSEKRQVFLSARELEFSAVPQVAQTWINKRLIYTHGYGFTMSPVNTVGEGGLPAYFVKDIGNGKLGGNLLTSSPEIAASIPIGAPRIYFGELTNTYIIAPSRVPELDYPSGNDNVYNHYSGKGGVGLQSLWRRLVFAVYLRDWQLLLTPNLTADSQILLRRQVGQRVRAIAPFLSLDKEPYLVVADTGPSNPSRASKLQEPNHLYWIVDAYTTSNHYPYADPEADQFNYIRNSVKVVVDAYTGAVDFYAVDLQDPILQAWQRVFPGLFQPLSAMPAELYQHTRYPKDLFQVQAHRLLKYHMTDPVVFYNQEDQWQLPTEIYDGQLQQVASYYLIMKLPEGEQEEFILLYPFTPLNRPNLIAWLAARSDGKNYGKLLLYQFPKQELIFGPEQLEARINQDPAISEKISLWNRDGSRLIQGNLLVIPLERSLLYVEPLYLKAEQNSLPTLIRVIVMYQDKIVMAETLDLALEQTFPAPSQSKVKPLALKA